MTVIIGVLVGTIGSHLAVVGAQIRLLILALILLVVGESGAGRRALPTTFSELADA